MATFIVVPTCNLCKYPRAACKCIASGRRIPNNDPYHSVFDEALSYITGTRYYGRTAHSDALVLIAEARQVALSMCARGEIDGFTFARIDRDAHRLVKKSEGRLYATAQALAEQDRRGKSKDKDKRAASLAVLEQFRARRRAVNE